MITNALAGESTVGDLISSRDWSETSLGALQAWPQSLRVALDICLSSALPSFVWWGADLIQLYNDAAVSILRTKHPTALGSRARESWSDVWQILGPRAEQVIATGKPAIIKDVDLTIDNDSQRRRAGFTLSYSVLRDDSGVEAGLLITAIEATHEARVSLYDGERRFRTLVSQVKDYAIFATDPEGRAVSWNEGVESVLGYSKEEFLGSSLELPFLAEDIIRGVPQKEFATARREGRANDDRWLRRKDGSAFFATGMTTRLDDESGQCIGFSKVLRDDTERVLAQQRLGASEERFRMLVQNLRDYAIFMIDENAIITEWPEGAQRVKGYSPEEALGQHLSMFYTPEDIASGEFDREVDEARREGRAEREGWRICKGGKRIWVNEIATAVHDVNGKLLGFTKISRDLTEQRQAEQALREADRRKDVFIATLAHELRNPLAPLRNGLQIARLTSKAGSPFQRTVEMMDRQLSHLVHLVDDLLDVGRISSGKIQLNCGHVALSEVLASSAEASQAIIEAHGHVLIVVPGSEELYVNGDFDRLTQVFSNLLSNAAKYTERGGKVKLSLARDAGHAVIKVIDSGIGIPETDLPHVFDLFSQVRAHQGRAEGGLGIGLSLVRRLVEMHHGAVSVTSAGPGKGSTFTVHLPLLQVDAPSPHRPEVELVQASGTRHRILVVDDNEDAALSLALLLEHYGHDVDIAHDGEQGVEKARSGEPDIVFLDLGMPRMNGIEAAKRLRSLPSGDDMLIVALTGWGQEKDQQRTRDAGFDRHLLKPVDPNALSKVLAERT